MVQTPEVKQGAIAPWELQYQGKIENGDDEDDEEEEDETGADADVDADWC